ncbi:MAG: hypothetical protein J0H91_21540, partial [Rhodospirillales bacterium]|nr:hypothetical protein [Rhodospirillales bacterium]
MPSPPESGPDTARETIENQKTRKRDYVSMIKHISRALLLAATLCAAATTARAETITVTHWGAAFYGAPYAVAMAKGFFKKNGVD